MENFGEGSIGNFSKRSFEVFSHTENPELQSEVMRLMHLADKLGVAALESSAEICASQQDEILSGIGGVLLTELEQIEVSESLVEDEQRETLIKNFEGSMDIFFPEGIALSEKAKLFSLTTQAATCPDKNSKKQDNESIYEARAELIEALIGKRYGDSNFYKGISVNEIFETAQWMYGGTEDEYQERGWSIDPVEAFKLNPQFLRYNKDKLEHATNSLADKIGVPVEKILTSAHRGIYRYINAPEKVEAEIDTLLEMGFTPAYFKRRPDLLNYPLKVIIERENALVAMGISLDVVRSNEKFYLYKPETIKERIDTIQQYITKLSENIISTEEAEIMMSQYLSRKSFLLDYGKDRIKTNLNIVMHYAQPVHWIEALRDAQVEDLNAKIGSILYNVLKVKPNDISQALENAPTKNVFTVARKIVNKNKNRKSDK
jgi:hypothetical protein